MYARRTRERASRLRSADIYARGRREPGASSPFSHISRLRRIVCIAPSPEIPPGAVVVALYFIFMQKRQITSRRGEAFASPTKSQLRGTFDPIRPREESGENVRYRVDIADVHVGAHDRLHGVFSAGFYPSRGVPVCEMTARKRAVAARCVRGR